MHLLICFRDNRAHCPGLSHRGLGVSSQLICNYLRKHHIRAECFPVDGHGMIEARLAADPSITHLVVMAPWMDPLKLAEWCAKYPETRFAVTCHSNLAFLQADRTASRLLPQYAALSRSVHNFWLAGNAYALSCWAGIVHHAPVLTLPNLYWVDSAKWKPHLPWRGGTLDIGMFGAVRHLKNLSTGAGATLLLQRQLHCRIRLHVNSGRVEGGDINVARQMVECDPHVDWIEAPWMDWPEFTQYVAGMNLLLQPSLTESFNIVTADGVANGVCSVVGPAIAWAPHDWHANPDDPCAIARVARRLLHDHHAPYEGLEALEEHNARGLRSWMDWLNG